MRAALSEKLVSEDERMMKQLQANSYLFGGNAPYVEELYERYLDNPGSVPEKWRAYFDQMQLVPAADGSPDSRDGHTFPFSKRSTISISRISPRSACRCSARP